MSKMLDPTFYRTPGDAIAAPPERLAYVAAFDPAGRVKDAMTVIDCDSSSSDYGRVVGWSELPTAGKRATPFRLERLLQRPVPPRPRRPWRRVGAALLDRAGVAVLADLCP